MDGVLVNNTQAHVKAFEIFCERYGVEDWQHKLQTAFGMGNDDIMRLILPEEIIREKGMKALGEEKEAIYREVYAHYSTCPIPSSSKKDSKRKVKAYRSEPIGAPGHIIRNKIVKYRLSYRPGNLRKRPLFFIFVALECIFNTFGSKYITFGHFITFRI